MEIKELREVRQHISSCLDQIEEPEQMITWLSIGNYKAMVACFNEEADMFSVGCALMVGAAALEGISGADTSNVDDLRAKIKLSLESTIDLIEAQMESLDE